MPAGRPNPPITDPPARASLSLALQSSCSQSPRVVQSRRVVHEPRAACCSLLMTGITRTGAYLRTVSDLVSESAAPAESEVLLAADRLQDLAALPRRDLFAHLRQRTLTLSLREKIANAIEFARRENRLAPDPAEAPKVIDTAGAHLTVERPPTSQSSTSGSGGTVTFLRVLAHASCCRHQRGDISHHSNTSTRATCAARCAADVRCSYFTHSGDDRHGRPRNKCSLCRLCSPVGGANTSSWARGWPGASLQTSLETVTTVLGLYMPAYSVALYGLEGAIELSSLALIWLRLLPAAAIAALSRVGLCKRAALPPSKPFYYQHDFASTPRNAVWLGPRWQRGRPLDDHTWVEVVHCTRNIRPVYGGGVMSALWAYVAPGSAVSVNVGRTLRADNYSHAVTMLHAIFGAGGKPTTAAGSRLLSSYDSLQILDHTEWFAPGELRHEIVLLRANESAGIDAVGARCGKPPWHLRACTRAELTRASDCVTAINQSPLEPPFQELRAHESECHESDESSAMCFTPTHGLRDEHVCAARMLSMLR